MGANKQAFHTDTTPGPAPNGMGTGLFAAKHISTGSVFTTIITPFVAVLDTLRLEDTCAGCFGQKPLSAGTNQVNLRACTGCRVTRYCDRQCQAIDWKSGHSLECKIFQNLAPRILPSNARAVLRMVLLSGRGKYSAGEQDWFMQLETHIREIRDRNMPQWERLLLSAKAVKAYSGSEAKEEVIAAFGAKLDLNAFNLTNALNDRIGLYLHPYVSFMNHSCDYNSVVTFDGTTCFVTALRPIEKGEQIFISYIDASNPFQTRRKELQERYYFKCECLKCSRGTDTHEDGFLETPQEPRFLEAVENQVNSLAQSATAPGTKAAETIFKLELAMQTLHKTSMWPITRQPYVYLRDELTAALLSANRFKTAFMHAAIRHTSIDPVIYSNGTHPVRQVHAWVLVKLAIHLSQGVETNPDDAFDLERYELNFGLVIWSILFGLWRCQSDAVSSSFKKMVALAFDEVHKAFIANGLDPSEMKSKIEREWEKVEVMVSAALRN